MKWVEVGELNCSTYKGLELYKLIIVLTLIPSIINIAHEQGILVLNHFVGKNQLLLVQT